MAGLVGDNSIEFVWIEQVKQCRADQQIPKPGHESHNACADQTPSKQVPKVNPRAANAATVKNLLDPISSRARWQLATSPQPDGNPWKNNSDAYKQACQKRTGSSRAGADYGGCRFRQEGQTVKQRCN
jgi:hypothetical protein